MKTNIMAYAAEVVNGKVLVAESTQDYPSYSNNIYDHLDYLLEDCDNKRKYNPYRYIKVCWDLEQFTACLFRLLPLEALKSISESKRVKIGNENRHYKLFYIPGKVFGITGRARIKENIWEEGEVNIYGIMQYFPDSYDPKKAVEIAELGDKVLYTLERMGIRNPNKLTSPVAVLQEAVLDHMKLPTIYDMPEKGKGAAEMCLPLMTSEWRACYKMGHWGNGRLAHDYDINSAYPYQIGLLPDTSACTYIKSDTPPPEYDWGIVTGRVWVESPYTPILYDDGEKDIPAIGSWEDVFTTELINWLYKHKCGRFKMDEGWFLKVNSQNRPYGVLIDRIFNYRQGNEITDKIAKSMAVGISGKLGEDNEEGGYGKLFNPIYRAMVLSRCKIAVADFIWNNNLQKDLVSVMVDGILSDRYVQVGISKKMGAWRYNGEYNALVIGSGTQWYADKRPLGLTYQEVVQAMREHPMKSYYGIKIKGQQTLSEAIKSGEMRTLGKMRDYEQVVDMVSLSPDMQYKKLPRNGGQVLNNIYEAEPVEVK